MKLEQLTIERLPGIAKGFTLDALSGDINLVTGPNTIGKSSLVRALRFLLRPPQRGDPPVSLSAAFRDGDASWRVERTGSRIQWRGNGEIAERPPLPDGEEVSRYCLSMEDLIDSNQTDQRLAEDLRRELSGGFDLGEPRIQLGGRHGANERNALVQAKRDLLKAERDSAQLDERRDQLPELAARIAEAGKAKEQCQRIACAQNLLAAVSEWKKKRTALDEYPPGMDKLGGEEKANLDRFRERRKGLEERLREAQQERDQAAQQIEQLGFDEAKLKSAESTRDIAERKLKQVSQLRETIKQRKIDETKAEARLELASQALGGAGPPQLDTDKLAEAERFAAGFIALQTRRDELETRKDIVGVAPNEQKIRQHEKAIDALRDWLSGSIPSRPPRANHWVLLTSLICGVLAGASPLFLNPAIGMTLFGATLLGIAIATWQQRPAVSTVGAQAREKFEALELPAPSAWSGREVRQRLRELEEVAGQLIAQRKRAEGVHELEQKLKTTREAIQEEEKKRQQLAESIGFDPTMPLTALDRFIHLVKEWDQVGKELAEVRREIVLHQQRRDDEAQALRESLQPWWSEPQSDLDALEGAAEFFQSRLAKAQTAAERLRLAMAEISNLDGQIKVCDEDIGKLFAGIDLDPGDEQGLRERLEVLDSWRQIHNEERDLGVQEKQFRNQLKDSPELCELADAGDEVKLEELREKQQSLANQLEKLRDERSGIEAKIEIAESGHSIAVAIKSISKAETSLIAKRDELLDKQATDLLLDQVEEAHTAEHQPEVLRNAGKLFREVTAHGFDIELAGDGGFQARDLTQNEMRGLDELSTGTRMQLLLAVRTAWVQTRRMLPLFLDEALITSDEVRTAEIVKSLKTLAESSGVQVIYFSARRSEAALWRQAVGDDLHVIDLGRMRGREESDEPVNFNLPEIPAVPAPGGSPEEYAQSLGVPAIDPHRDPGEIHLFHLLRDDLGLLHRLLSEYRIATLGQVQSLLERDASEEDSWRGRLLGRCRGARNWVHAWRRGRERKISRSELEASGAISDTFMEPVSALLASYPASGSPGHLLERLRAREFSGFRGKKADELEAWLRENGYLDEREPLSSAGRRSEVLRQCDPADEKASANIAKCIDWLEAGIVK